MRRLLGATATMLVAIAALTPALAFAHDGGQGIYGETNDKVVANVGFGVIIFFVAFVFLASMIQRHFERRKDARLAAAKARATSPEWSRGW